MFILQFNIKSNILSCISKSLNFNFEVDTFFHKFVRKNKNTQVFYGSIL